MAFSFARWLPTRESLESNRWLRWAAPALGKPELWRMQVEPVARAAAVGAFFAFALPVGQIPAAVFFAILLRLNLPVAVAATFVNTPLTFAPVYYAAYRVGASILELEQQVGVSVSDKGSALALGTSILAVAAALLAYLVVHAAWRLRSRSK